MPLKSFGLDLQPAYDADQDRGLPVKGRARLAWRLSRWRDQQLARKALKLAGEPNLVLDFPSFKGRFWALLAELPTRVILVAEGNEPSVRQALELYPSAVALRVKPFEASLNDIPLDANAVDCIFCMRFMQHIPRPVQRSQILSELHRVTRDTLIISLWVDGNYKSWKRKKLEQKRSVIAPDRPASSRYVVERSVIESEFRAAGFNILDHFDFLPGYAMWRFYVLRKSH